MNRFVIISAALFIVGSAQVAAAADNDADALVARGLELRRAGKTEEALELFERAYALAPSPRTVGQMGLAEASLQRWLDAEKHLNSSLGAGGDTWVRKNKTLLEQAIELTYQHVGHVMLIGPAGAAIAFAGHSVGTLPMPAPVRVVEGTLLVTATAPGYKQLVQAVTVPGGGHVTVELALKPVEVRPAEPAETTLPVVSLQRIDNGESSWRPWTAGALFVVGAAAIAWGTTWVAVDGNNSCGDGPNCHTVYNTRKPGWAILGVGAASAVAGGVVLLTAHHRDSEVSLAAVPSGLEVGGRF